MAGPHLDGRGDRGRVPDGGERYASLTALARKITGARWSGPRFFGLTEETRADDGPAGTSRRRKGA
ncbi:DUF2924 domain-containing protein [Paracoccus spongiarum]|uniref:DUF2924 domain-containing protein n=1 Tax=Paracoccus spongiarum TaxID=3064387 RepID=UPI003531D24B